MDNTMKTQLLKEIKAITQSYKAANAKKTSEQLMDDILRFFNPVFEKERRNYYEYCALSSVGLDPYSIEAKRQWCTRSSEGQTSLQDKIVLDHLYDFILTEAHAVFSELAPLLPANMTEEQRSEIEKSHEIFLACREAAFLKYLDEISFAFYYLSLNYIYLEADIFTEKQNADGMTEYPIKDFMFTEWFKTSHAHRTREANIESARVWFNLKCFWTDTNHEEFFKTFHTMEDAGEFFNEENRNDFSVFYGRSGFIKKLDEKVDNKFYTDILILTANKVEHLWVSKLLRRLAHKLLPSERVIRYDADADKMAEMYELAKISKNIRILHVAAGNTGSFTLQGSAIAVKNALNLYTYPARHVKLIVSLGVAYGLFPEYQHLGDVLVSKRIFSYETYKRKNESVTFDPDESFELIKSFRNSTKSVFHHMTHENLSFQIYYDDVLSGGMVLSDASEKQRLLRAAKENDLKPIGGEMEGTGVCFVLRTSGYTYERIPFLIMKGICDWGAMKNSWALIEEDTSLNKNIKNAIQAQCVYNAFQTLLLYLKENKDKEYPQYNGLPEIDQLAEILIKS